MVLGTVSRRWMAEDIQTGKAEAGIGGEERRKHCIEYYTPLFPVYKGLRIGRRNPSLNDRNCHGSPRPIENGWGWEVISTASHR